MEAFRPEAVLIVDDDDCFVRTLTRELRRLGFPFVFRATCASHAVAMLDRVHPTLVFVNIREHELSERRIITRAKQLGASVVVVCGRSELLTEEFELPLQDKSTLVGQTLETLVVALISQAQQRSRVSTNPREIRVA